MSMVRGRGSSMSTILRNATRTRRHRHDPVGKQNGFRYVVGHEDHGLLVGVPDAHQFEAELLARHRIERGEWFVHQQHRGIVDQRATDRHALLHSAGKFARIALLETARGQPSLRSVMARVRDSVLSSPQNFSRQQDVVQHRAPLQENRLLKHDSHVVWWGAGAARHRTAAFRARGG